MRRERIQIGTPLEAPLTSTSEYMKWYRRNTRRWIGRSSASLGQVVDMVEQLHISSSAPPPNFTLANRTGLAANRTRLRDDEPSSSSSHGTQSSTPAPTGPPPHQPQQHFPQHPFSYPGYLVYPIPPPHTGAAGSSSSSTTVPPFPPPFLFSYPYPPYQFPPPPPPS
ncbi:hypothetical protein PIB30_035465 [Stylosanthes scabra]|uniref:Uncharacterized protein n=1 Tax=Stylosanthes scabra TaxID=79078 RepID=A0ABU6VF97_9FABA|nr:hypothetical protein [Stylosanthes scabra]